MWYHEIIRAEVNSKGFLKSILNVGGFTRQFTGCYYIINAGDSRPILGNWKVWPEMECEFFFALISHTVKK